MRLSIKGLALSSGVLWSCSMFVAGLANLIHPGYALSFLNVVDSIYPGYHAGQGFVSVLVGTGYAFIDGLIGGAVGAWLYNCFS